MIEELIKVLKKPLLSNIRLTKINLVDIIKIFEHYNNFTLNEIIFDEYEHGSGFDDTSNSIIWDSNNLKINAENWYINTTKQFNITMEEFYNYYMLFVIFHELTHAKQYNLGKVNELDKRIWDLNSRYVEQFNKLYLNENHDLLTIEREASIEAWYLTNVIAKQLVKGDIVNYTSNMFFDFLLKEYIKLDGYYTPIDLFIESVPNNDSLNRELRFLKKTLTYKYIDINYDHLKYGLELNYDETLKLYYIWSLFHYNKFTKKQRERYVQEDLKELIKIER